MEILCIIVYGLVMLPRKQWSEFST